MSHSLEQVHREMREMIRGVGLRVTSPRLAVLAILHELGAPRTHEQIMAALPPGGFDKATVWRILADLHEAGLLRRMDLGDRIWRYELLDACRTVEADHPHFLCETCGAVICLPPLEVRSREGALPEALRNAEIQIRVSGTCGACLGKQ